MSLIEQVNSPPDLKRLSMNDLSLYAKEVRELIVNTVTENGGHLSSNLGAVELTIALHYAFSAPDDKLVFDVGHQTYTHKIITGRAKEFTSLRKDGGISGFPNAKESEYDVFTTGHSSNSLSLGVGLCRARALKKQNHSVVAVIGDGAFTGGMAFEALNDIGAKQEKMIIVLNDNKMSISKNVGAFSNYLAKLRLSRRYSSLKYKIKRGVSALPFFGAEIVGLLDKIKDSIKISLLPNKIFENLGVKYYGPLNGHDIPRLVDALKRLKSAKGPVILHVVTEKGKGVEEIMQAPDKYHGVSAKMGSNNEIPYSSVVREKICELAKLDDRVVAVTAAMSSGTGLDKFEQEFPERYFDVGIAEQHATSMCAGFATSGMKPYFAVYSSFLQRAYDQIMQDVCIDCKPVTFLIDHAGVVDGDGVTHQGLYDISYLRSFPNMTILEAKDGQELCEMMDFSLNYAKPLAIRYAKSYACDFEKREPFTSLCWETVRKEKSDTVVLAVGNYANSLALSLSGVTVINARVIKPLDEKILDEISSAKRIVTIEDGIENGGFGEAVRAYFANRNNAPVVMVVAHPDKFISSTSKGNIYLDAGITAEKIEKRIKSL